jgi:hypothetical protein
MNVREEMLEKENTKLKKEIIKIKENIKFEVMKY